MKLIGKWDVWLDRTRYRNATEVEMLGRGSWVRFIHDGKIHITSFPVIILTPMPENKTA